MLYQLCSTKYWTPLKRCFHFVEVFHGKSFKEAVSGFFLPLLTGRGGKEERGGWALSHYGAPKRTFHCKFSNLISTKISDSFLKSRNAHFNLRIFQSLKNRLWNTVEVSSWRLSRRRRNGKGKIFPSPPPSILFVTKNQIIPKEEKILTGRLYVLFAISRFERNPRD